MNQRDLIKEMMIECPTLERSQIEDFYNAQKDLVTERLNRRENVVIPGLGYFEFVTGRSRPLRFRFTAEIYQLLNVRVPSADDLCAECGKEPRLRDRRVGRKCVSADRAKRWPRKRLAK